MKLNILQDGTDPFRVVYCPVDEDRNINGTVHGGILFYVCDEAIGRYVKSLGRVGAAADANIHYYRPAKIGEIIAATVQVRKLGRRLGIFLVEARDEASRLLADLLITIAFTDDAARLG